MVWKVGYSLEDTIPCCYCLPVCKHAAAYSSWDIRLNGFNVCVQMLRIEFETLLLMPSSSSLLTWHMCSVHSLLSTEQLSPVNPGAHSHLKWVKWSTQCPPFWHLSGFSEQNGIFVWQYWPYMIKAWLKLKLLWQLLKWTWNPSEQAQR